MVLWDVTHVAWYKGISFLNKYAAFNLTAEEIKSDTAGSFKRFVTIYQAT